MRKIIIIVVLLAMFLFPIYARAQETPAPLDLRLTRDWGYGGTNGEIQGTFSLRVKGPADVVRVAFIVDGAVVNTDTEPPFRYQFNTGDRAVIADATERDTLVSLGVAEADGVVVAGEIYEGLLAVQHRGHRSSSHSHKRIEHHTVNITAIGYDFRLHEDRLERRM